ncbi:hypothetical protein Q1695_009452 [Nippostrongylus brasiliensis]|nr:hypothetical protein Q1695_009452 [Nippostrongylus brasiliensis]
MEGAEIGDALEDQEFKPLPEHFEVVTIDVQPDEEVLEYTQEIPPPDEGFLRVCAAIDPNMSEQLRDSVWTQVCTMVEKVDLDDETIAYVACAFYCVMLEMEKFQQRPFPYSILTILEICSVSVVEFFDKLGRWVDIATSSKKIADHSHRIESSLSVSFVVFKKLLPIFRSLFHLVKSDLEDHDAFDSSHLFTMVWLIIIIMKKSLPTEDLLTSFHLLLCVIEWVYKDLCSHNVEAHIEPESVNHMMENKDGVRVLEVLCRSFDGVLLDAKHFRTHWFNQKRESILPFIDHKNPDFATNFQHYIASLNEMYTSIMLRKGELDERIFLPTDIANVFDAAFDAAAVDLLRSGSADNRFADAELLLTMSTQNCLEKLAEVKYSPTRSDARSYVISSHQLRPLCPITQPDNNTTAAQRLSAIVPSEYKLEGSALERYCTHAMNDPLSEIKFIAYMIGERFVETVASEGSDSTDADDQPISQSADEDRKAMTMLFYVLLEHIVLGERKQNPDRDFQGLLRKEEFLSAVFCCAMELVLFVQESKREFPWCLEVCGLPAVSFQKIIEVVIRNEPNLSREMVRHLNRLEELVLEKWAWTQGSPLWTALSRRSNSVPSCEQAWGNGRTPTASPPKRMRFEVMEQNNMHQVPPCTAQMSFFSKLYYLALMRLSDLCERIRIDERGRRMMWTVLEYILQEEHLLLKDRHLDQNLLCIVYVVCKANKSDVSFLDIMAHYRNQPQAHAKIYRMVRVDSDIPSNGNFRCEDDNSADSPSGGDSGNLRSQSATGGSPEAEMPSSDGPAAPKSSEQYVDLIVYYNKVFLPRVENFMKSICENMALSSLTPMPVRRIPRGTPLRRSLSDKVTVMPYSPLPSSQRNDPNTIRYKISQSPSQDFRAINRLLSRSQPIYKTDMPTPTGSLSYRIMI